MSSTAIQHFLAVAQPRGWAKVGGQYLCHCPAHADRVRSLAVQVGDDGRILLYCHAGCATEDVLRAFGLEWSDLFAEAPRSANGSAASFEPEAVYSYVDEQGRLLFQQLRYPGKQFRPQRPAPEGGRWIANLRGVRRVLYHLNELQTAQEVWLVEGEKDADRLRSLGLVATTAFGGAGKGAHWREEYTAQLLGKQVCQIADNDDPGRAYADEVAERLSEAGIRVFRARLSGLPEHGDVSDWLDAGHSVEELKSFLFLFSPIDTKQKQETGWLMISVDELLADDYQEPPDLVAGGLCPTGGLSILGAKPKVGKSTFARSLCVCVSQGKHFLDREVRQGPAIYVALEEKRKEIRDHFERLGHRQGDPLYVVLGVEPQDAVRDLNRAIELVRPVLVVIDPLFRFVKFRDASDYAEMINKLAPVLSTARDTGTHVLLTHHNTKTEREGGDDILGSTAIFGAVDTAIIYRRRQGGMRFAYSVQRYGSDMEETVLTLSEEGQVITAGSVERYEIARAADRILKLLEHAEEPVSTLEMVEVLGMARGPITKALLDLVEQEKVLQWGKGRRGDPFRYSLKREES